MSFFSLSLSLHFHCKLFYFFEIDIIPLNTGYWIQSPIRVEYKLHQSTTATAASDKSLSDTLMPSNCLWRPLPVCFLTWTPASPHPISLQVPSPLPVSSTAKWCFSPTCHVSAWLPSCGLHTSKMAWIDCATCVWLSSRRASVLTMLTPPPYTLSIFVVLFSILSGFRDLITFCTCCESFFLQSGCICAFRHLNAK